jgi:ferrous iron transport protein B
MSKAKREISPEGGLCSSGELILKTTKSTESAGKILLMGNPNVGKSVFFTELTGIHAVSSNFTGTTVTFMEGTIVLGQHGEKKYTLVDVPGTYSLSATSEAESVAAQFMNSGASAVICVLDASNLERNLRLALEMQQYGIPTIYTLNLTDVAQRRGISVSAKLLETELNAPVIPTVAVKKKGFAELKQHLGCILELTDDRPFASCGKCTSCPKSAEIGKNYNEEAIRAVAKEIAARVIKRTSQNPGFLDRLGESMMKPFPGIPIALLVLAMLIGVVVVGGELLREFLLYPFVNEVIVPFFRNAFTSLLPEGVFLNILVGEFGIFVISFQWILALIFPYVLLFYVTFSFLEDSGYLPRIGVLFDNVMRKLGVQGGSLIYVTMGFGCAVPAIIGSRAATSRKERLVITAAICFAIPCVSQLGALLSLLGAYAWWMLPVTAGFGLLLFTATSLIAGKLIKGTVDPLILEVPNLLIPEPRAYGRKLLTRMKHFLKDAEIPMMLAIVIAAVLSESGLLEVIARHSEPLMVRWLGMPSEAVVGLILGIIRREMMVAPLLELDLTALQAFIGGAVSLMYLPCLSVFAILVKEFKLRIAATISLLSIFVALFVGGLINQIAQLF